MVTEWQWHQLGHMQICILFQTDNHASITAFSFFTGQMPFLLPNQQHQGTEGRLFMTIYYYYYIRLTAFFQDNLGKPAPEKQNHSGKAICIKYKIKLNLSVCLSVCLFFVPQNQPQFLADLDEIWHAASFHVMDDHGHGILFIVSLTN